MPAITGNELVADAFGELNVFIPGATIPNPQAQFARRKLNDMLSEWSQRDPFTAFISRNPFTMTAGKGGPNNRYTIGIGGDFNVEKPSNQNSITAANLILTNSSPNVRVPLGIYTDDAYDANAIPDMSNGQPTGLYYNPTFQGDLGSIFLWPVPDVAYNLLELFLQESVAQFADLTTVYYVPDGYPQAMKYNLADRLQGPFGRTLSAAAQRLAISSMSTIKRANNRLADMANDFSFGGDRSTIYNILTGS